MLFLLLKHDLKKTPHFINVFFTNEQIPLRKSAAIFQPYKSPQLNTWGIPDMISNSGGPGPHKSSASKARRSFRQKKPTHLPRLHPGRGGENHPGQSGRFFFPNKWIRKVIVFLGTTCFPFTFGDLFDVYLSFLGELYMSS